MEYFFEHGDIHLFVIPIFKGAQELPPRLPQPPTFPFFLIERLQALLLLPWPVIVATYIQRALALEFRAQLPELVVDSVQFNWIQRNLCAIRQCSQLLKRNHPHRRAYVDVSVEMNQLEPLKNRVAQGVGIELPRLARVREHFGHNTGEHESCFQAPILALAQLAPSKWLLREGAPYFLEVVTKLAAVALRREQKAENKKR